MKKILSFMFTSLFAVNVQATSFPTEEEALMWWIPTENIESFSYCSGEYEIFLRNGERAYLQGVCIVPAGRNHFVRTLMIRPDLKEARIVELPVKSAYEVYDLNQDGVSEVVVGNYGSGQGSNAGTRYVVQFDEWEPIVLYESSYQDNEGMLGRISSRYFRKELNWQFVDLDSNGVTDLLERITFEEGRNTREPRVTNYTYRWYFAENRFMRLPEYREYLRQQSLN